MRRLVMVIFWSHHKKMSLLEFPTMSELNQTSLLQDLPTISNANTTNNVIIILERNKKKSIQGYGLILKSVE